MNIKATLSKPKLGTLVGGRARCRLRRVAGETALLRHHDRDLNCPAPKSVWLTRVRATEALMDHIRRQSPQVGEGRGNPRKSPEDTRQRILTAAIPRANDICIHSRRLSWQVTLDHWPARVPQVPPVQPSLARHGDKRGKQRGPKTRVRETGDGTILLGGPS